MEETALQGSCWTQSDEADPRKGESRRFESLFRSIAAGPGDVFHHHGVSDW
jgi:hypothetical protein